MQRELNVSTLLVECVLSTAILLGPRIDKEILRRQKEVKKLKKTGSQKDTIIELLKQKNTTLQAENLKLKSNAQNNVTETEAAPKTTNANIVKETITKATGEVNLPDHESYENKKLIIDSTDYSETMKKLMKIPIQKTNIKLTSKKTKENGTVILHFETSEDREKMKKTRRN